MVDGTCPGATMRERCRSSTRRATSIRSGCSGWVIPMSCRSHHGRSTSRRYGEPVRGTLAYASSDNGTPTLDDRWHASDQGATTQLGDVLAIAGDGGTSRLGSVLAPMGVRYIVVPLGPAPEPYSPPTSRPDRVVSMLDAQLDLSPVTAAGVVLYRNNAWGPTRALLPADTQPPSGGPALADRFFPPVRGRAGCASRQRWARAVQRHDRQPERAVPGRGFVERLAARCGRFIGASRDALGWANVFQVDQTGDATLRFATPVARYLMLFGQLLLWIIALVFCSVCASCVTKVGSLETVDREPRGRRMRAWRWPMLLVIVDPDRGRVGEPRKRIATRATRARRRPARRRLYLLPHAPGPWAQRGSAPRALPRANRVARPSRSCTWRTPPLSRCKDG